MPTYTTIYRNCSCCSGSGSSGSGSSPYDCSFFSECPGTDIVNYVASVRITWGNCGSMGSCGSGSGASGAETGLDGPTTGSGSDCLQTCPSCCDVLPTVIEFSLECIGGILTTTNMVQGSPDFCTDISGSSSVGSCKGFRKDRCKYLSIYNSGGSYLIFMGIPVDNGMLEYNSPGITPTVDSCSPLHATFQQSGVAVNYSSLSGACLTPCITYTDIYGMTQYCPFNVTITITEASSGGGGGGPVL